MPQHTAPSTTRFAGYSDPVIHSAPSEDSEPIQHLLWGDWLRMRQGRSGDWREVFSRGAGGWIHKDHIQPKRILEIVFVDIGQGDGCLVVTPEDEHIVIDAGEDDSMYRFLNWRYGGFAEGWKFDAGIITHPDSDHYRGFHDLFLNPFVTFKSMYHNGIMERRKTSFPLGPNPKHEGRRFVSDLIRNKADLETFLGDETNWRHPHPTRRQWDKLYATVLNDGVANQSFEEFEILHSETGFVPGWEPGSKSIDLQVLGPILERPASLPDGGLRVFGSKAGYTKNGHSVVIKLNYQDVSILLGGDLNIPAQEFLLEHYTGLNPRPESKDEYDALVEAAGRTFQVDIAKACHHGAADVSTRFLASSNPVATVISSGDNESHGHPRADALGATGRHGRGNRPLIFSTELGRSAPNTIKRPEVMKARMKELRETIPLAENAQLRKKLIREFNTLVDSIDRSVAVYGAVHLRTDGERVVMAQKLEVPRGQGQKWDVYRLEPQGIGGGLQYVSKYD